MNDCNKTILFGLLPACRFKPRYTVIKRQLPKHVADRVFDLDEVIESYEDKIYVGDVCERCGKTIDTKPKE